ncbi:MAG: DHH family phosphoesterase [Flavobacteriaceae bacterium]
MNSEEIQLTKEILSTPKKIVITPHKNPDGDAIGSSLGLWHYLKQGGHMATVIVPNDFPKNLKWMPGVEEIVVFDKNSEKARQIIQETELIFTLDFNDLSRIGDMQSSFKASAADFIMIDHHQDPHPYAKITYSDVSMSSTAEMVYNFIEYLGGRNKVNSEIATCLYSGIVTDTGSFKFRSTTSRTHIVVANLIDSGADNSKIHNKIFDTNSPDRLHLLGRALNNLVILQEYSTAYITLSKKDLEEFNFKKGDTEGFVNYALTLHGICFAAIFIENGDDGHIKMSFRSEGDFSVNEFARANFNGGGHINAAGGRIELSLADTVTKFVNLLEQYKDQLSS